MKIAVISDIHGNKLAFDKVMEDIKIYKPDMIFCLGDIIMAGYNPNYICEKIINLKNDMKDNFQIIQGNTDKMVSMAYFGNEELIKKAIEAFPCMGYSLKEDIKITDKKHINFVSSLPETINLEVNGLKIALCHGSPRNQSENIYPDMDLSEIEKMVKQTDAELILCGHTHIPCGYSLNSGKTVINVGSVGRPMTQDRKPCYLQLAIDKTSKFFVEHKIISYDNKQVARYILSRNFNNCEDLAEMFL